MQVSSRLRCVWKRCWPTCRKIGPGYPICLSRCDRAGRSWAFLLSRSVIQTPYANDFTKKSVNFDQAYLTIRPGKSVGLEPGWFWMTLGKFGVNAYRVSELVWDDDLTPEGATETCCPRMRLGQAAPAVADPRRTASPRTGTPIARCVGADAWS